MSIEVIHSSLLILH